MRPNSESMVPTGYNPALVALSIAIAVFASYTALDLGGRVRGAASKVRLVWLAGGGGALVGLYALLLVAEFIQRGMVAGRGTTT